MHRTRYDVEMIRVVCWIAVAITAGACDKKRAPAASGALSSAESELLSRVPAGNHLVWGGSYAKLQDFMQRSALGRASREAAEEMGGKGMATWMQCISSMQSLRFAGGIRFGDAGTEMRMVTSGAGIDDFRGCATKAGLTAAVDPDGKFLRVELPGPSEPIAQGYLVVADRVLYMRGAINFGAGMTITSAPRAQLEADVAGAREHSAATDASTSALLAKVDRSKTAWFAGNATPIAKGLGEVYGSLDVNNGIAVDVVVQFTDQQLQTQIEDNLDQVKKHVDEAPSKAMKQLVDNISARRVGDRTRFSLKATDEQLDALMQMSGGMFGGM